MAEGTQQAPTASTPTSAPASTPAPTAAPATTTVSNFWMGAGVGFVAGAVVTGGCVAAVNYFLK